MVALPCRVILGKTTKIFDGQLLGSGETCIDFTLDDSDSILASLYVRSVTSGTVSAILYTRTVGGEKVAVITFPDITAPTTELLLKKAAIGLSNMQLCITHTGDAEVSVYGKGLTAGEASVRILGASSIKTSQIDATSSGTLLVPAALVDRAGMVVKNNSTTETLYLGETQVASIASNGYPMLPGEAMGIDIAAGVELYGRSSGADIDVRILEADS